MVVWFQRFESFSIGLACFIGFLLAGFTWWWLFALFLLFDLSMLGYLRSPQLGAAVYNAVHSYVVPGLLLAFAFLLQTTEAFHGGLDLKWGPFYFLGCVWVFHIAVDRAIGYGLKFSDRFNHTHLGAIGHEH